jgi:hypothetical protein
MTKMARSKTASKGVTDGQKTAIMAVLHQEDVYPQCTTSSSDVEDEKRHQHFCCRSTPAFTHRSLSTCKEENANKDEVSKNGIKDHPAVKPSEVSKVKESRDFREKVIQQNMYKFSKYYSAGYAAVDTAVEKRREPTRYQKVGQGHRELQVNVVTDMNKQFIPHPPANKRGNKTPALTRPGFVLRLK